MRTILSTLHRDSKSKCAKCGSLINAKTRKYEATQLCNPCLIAQKEGLNQEEIAKRSKTPKVSEIAICLRNSRYSMVAISRALEVSEETLRKIYKEHSVHAPTTNEQIVEIKEIISQGGGH